MSEGRASYKFICLLLGLLVLTSCSAAPAAAPTPSMLTPLESAQIVDPAMLDAVDIAALHKFFSRWGAYMATVGIQAQDEQDVYGGLYAYSSNWEQALTANIDGGCQVILYLPASPGLLEVTANGGRIRLASLSYNSEDAEVRASLAFTVASNALIYAVIQNDDMNSVVSIYNECMTKLHQSGAEMAGIAKQDGYTFSLTLAAGDQNMSFVAIADEP